VADDQGGEVEQGEEDGRAGKSERAEAQRHAASEAVGDCAGWYFGKDRGDPEEHLHQADLHV